MGMQRWWVFLVLGLVFTGCASSAATQSTSGGFPTEDALMISQSEQVRDMVRVALVEQGVVPDAEQVLEIRFTSDWRMSRDHVSHERERRIHATVLFAPDASGQSEYHTFVFLQRTDGDAWAKLAVDGLCRACLSGKTVSPSAVAEGDASSGADSGGQL